ncbi:MAG TPA: S8 family serine peptidase, partial [Chitinophagaceae bacterium]|nr:S8 family serine peptidase [Chitinophagaceae bacterium]
MCKDNVNKLLYRFHLDSERLVIEKIKEQNPSWSEHDGACSRCVDYYHTQLVMQQRILPEIGPHFPVRSADDFVILPTGLRLDADQRFTGKGVTICFIDSGFCPHPDLTAHKNRIKKIVDITKRESASNRNDSSQVSSSGGDLEGAVSSQVPSSLRSARNDGGDLESAWHGTMTTVVCAGDGFLSKGLYKGIASDAELVLLKVQYASGRITTAHIVKALQWVLQHNKEYGIRIVNMSITDDDVVSYKQSEVDQLTEQLIEKGIVVVAAVGNDENGSIKPPANALNVIAVGGMDDHNRLGEPVHTLYHSSFGKTIDQLMKPELLAHAIWIAAPILPGTEEQQESELLHQLLELPDNHLFNGLQKINGPAGKADFHLQTTDTAVIKESIRHRIQA